jgi:FkbM family methyltransferase
MSSPFFHYNSSFDAQGLMNQYAANNLEPHPKFLTNFLGVLIDPKFFPEILNGRAGQVEPIPIPANWHADIAEWAAALRAVDLAGPNFVAVELGCGWGCWLNNTGVAARRTGRKVDLIGIEGDVSHLAFAREAYVANGFFDADVTLVRGIAAAREGVALFPRQSAAGGHWGLEPRLNVTKFELAKARLTGDYEEVRMVSLEKVLQKQERVDLLHIDIQGGEADLLQECLGILAEKVGYVVVGTHSREIEGRIFSSMRSAGWLLEMERPAIYSLPLGVPQLTVDGVQGWRNPRLLPL